MSQELDQTEESQHAPSPGDDPEKFLSLSSDAFKAWILSRMWLKQGTLLPVESEKATRALLDETKRAFYFLAHSSLFREEPPEILPRHHSGVADKEARERQVEILRAERDKFATQSQLLQSRVSELRRTAAREIQRYDQLLVNHSEMQRQNARLHDRIEKLIDCLNDRATANDCLQSILISRFDGRLRMTESYEGVVEDVDGDKVLVVYDVNGKIVEQTYEKSQFVDGHLPDVGTRLVVLVSVAEVQLKPVESGVEETETHDEPPDSQRKPLSGTIEF